MPGLLSALGASIGLNQIPSSSSSLTGTLPWSDVDSAFFPFLIPKGELWSALVPYRLIVVDTANNNEVVGGNDPNEVTVTPLGNGTLAFTPLDQSWQFQLPITPQQLSITDTYSINTSATLRGVSEQHSGVRFKNIVISGTLGIWPGKPSVVNPPGTPSVLQSVFGGTITAAQNVATQFSSIINNVNNGSFSTKPKTIRPGDSSDPEKGLGTGYYQTLMLTQFLEQYAEAKRNPDNAGWRLVFDIPKQNQSFVVTPISFTWRESENRPMEINYNLQFKAWRRINLNNNFVSAPLQVTPLSPGALQNILNTISAAQNTAAAATSLIGSVRSDVDNILNIIRQTGIFVKQLAGVALTAADLPAQLASDAKSTISNFLSTVNPNNLFGPAATDKTTLTALSNIKALNQTNEGLSTTAVNNGQLGSSSAASAALNPSNAVFSSPLQYPLLLGQVPVNNLVLNTAQQNALQTEINTVNNFTVANLKTMRSTILTLATQLSNSFGAGNSYYSTLFNQPTPIVTSEPMTLDDYDILTPFYSLAQSYDLLTATNQLDNDQALNSMEFVSALASNSGIEFSSTNSKIQVPVPFGLNMEQIAQRYLGDSHRWLEIVTLNFLREPYIDENGFQYPLLSNADGRSIVVGNNEDLHIGQKIFLYAVGQTPTSRTINNITTLSQTSFLITLDGLENLSGFTVTNQAYLQAYLPGTVNSQNVIFCPSNLPAPPFDQINIPASVANVDLVGLSKIDFLLTPTGDIAVNNTGDFQLAAGITNLIQALTIKLSTTLGTSLLNPDFGLGVKPGVMVSDTSAADIYNQINNLITEDPRFSSISGLQISLTPPSLNISMAIQLSGIQGLFPVAFQLPTTQ